MSSLKKKAKDNTTVTQGTKNNQVVKQEGTPNDHHRKQLEENCPIVGVSLGITKNMSNYESLRVDCWLTDKVGNKETVEQAYSRVLQVVDKVLQDTVNSYIE